MKKITKIIGISTLTVIGGILSITDIGKNWFREYKEDVTTVKMFIKDQQISNHDSRTFFICISDTTQSLENLSVTPVYENSAEYPIKSFDLRYLIKSSEAFDAEDSPFFTLQKINSKEYQYRYKDKSLSQISQTEEPFSLSSLPKKDGYYIITSRASIAGVSTAYEFTVYVWIRVVPKKRGQTMNEWELVCQDVINNTQPKSQTFDRYFFCDGKFVNHFGKDIAPAVSDNNILSYSKPKDQDKVEKNKTENKVSENTNNEETKPTHEAEQEKLIKEESKLEILSYDIIKKDNKNYLRLITQNTTPGKTYRFVCTYDNGGWQEEYVYWFKGFGCDTVLFNAFNYVEISDIVLPELDNDLKNNIYTTTNKSGQIVIKNKGLKKCLVEFLINDSVSSIGLVSKMNSLILRNTKNKDNVKIISTYKYKKFIPWYNYIVNLIFIIISILCIYAGVDGLRIKSERNWGGFMFYGAPILFGIAILIIFTIDIFTPIASDIPKYVFSLFR